jgi:hypothetical protein
MEGLFYMYQNKSIGFQEKKMSKILINKVFAVTTCSMIALSLLIAIPSKSVYASGLEGKGGPGGNGGSGQWISEPGSYLTPLSNVEVDALQKAILEEYGALNLYSGVINQLGNIYPFSQIATAEQKHIDALTRQAVKYGVSVPENPGLTVTIEFNSVAEACQAGVAAEIADAELYDELKPDMTHTDILQVFNNLQSASLNSHLPAFQACQ